MTQDQTVHCSSQERSRKSFEHSPKLVLYEVTQACDLVCLHCPANSQNRRDFNELDTEAATRLISQLNEFPTPPSLTLTGGDPLKRPDIYGLIDRAVDAELDVSITLSPTALVSREAVSRLRGAGIKHIEIGLDGADATTHQTVRGVRGSFQRTMEIIGDARQLGVEVHINSTLTPVSIEQIEMMADQFGSLGIALWSVYFLIPQGKDDHRPRLNADQCERAFEQLWLQSKKQPYLIKTTEAPHYRRYVIQHRITCCSDLDRLDTTEPGSLIPAGINDGKGVMFVTHTGEVYPGGFLPVKCGSFPRESVVDIYPSSTIFKTLRDRHQLEGKCGRCEFRHICGGSRARAYAVTGNLLAEEPDCNYFP